MTPFTKLTVGFLNFLWAVSLIASEHRMPHAAHHDSPHKKTMVQLIEKDSLLKEFWDSGIPKTKGNFKDESEFAYFLVALYKGETGKEIEIEMPIVVNTLQTIFGDIDPRYIREMARQARNYRLAKILETEKASAIERRINH